VVRLLTDRVAVMYLGRIVECGPAADVFSRPAHPYTWLLVEAVLQNFERSAAIAAAFLDWPLGPEDEMAPVFTPVTEP
jgi:ABC-type dipeptide/oligopeptide/nickel transport system ATPase component